MVSAGARQPREQARISSLPTLASTGSWARWWPATTLISSLHATAVRTQVWKLDPSIISLFFRHLGIQGYIQLYNRTGEKGQPLHKFRGLNVCMEYAIKAGAGTQGAQGG